jgi:hypothetical protein
MVQLKLQKVFRKNCTRILKATEGYKILWQFGNNKEVYEIVIR